MKLIQRMFIKQLLAIAIPCVVAAIVYIMMISVFVRGNENVHDSEGLQESIARVQIYNNVLGQIKEYTFRQDELFFEAVATNLAQVHSGLVVANKDTIVYISNNLDKLNSDLLSFPVKHKKDSITLGQNSYMLRYNEQLSEDGLTYVFVHQELKGMSKKSLALIVALVAFILAYIACCIYINARLNRKLIQPIHQIKHAAVEISEGKLDSIIVVDTQDEIEELNKALDFLRIKLKESIIIQQKYDDNRSFLISSISHDLRTPVTTIKGYVEALRDGVAQSPEKKEQYLHIIDKKANQINEMIEDLLLYSKLDLNQIPFNLEKVNLVNYLQDGIDEFTPFFQTHHVDLNFQILTTTPIEKINGNIDLTRFMRVIQNIWNNAVAYNDKYEKTIEITIRETYSSYVIEIKDNGKGIESQDANQIFERFFRTDRARQSDQGSGLGLAIAKHIIEAHQGQIWARGQLTKGMSIYISLPKIKE